MVIHLNRIHAEQIKRSIKFVYTSLMSTVRVMLPKHFLKNFYPLFLFPSVCSVLFLLFSVQIPTIAGNHIPFD